MEALYRVEAVQNRAYPFFMGVNKSTSNLANLGGCPPEQKSYRNRVLSTADDGLPYKIYTISTNIGRSLEQVVETRNSTVYHPR